MIAFLITIVVFWLVWRWVFRSMATHVEIAPPAPTTITINVLVKDMHVHTERKIDPPLS